MMAAPRPVPRRRSPAPPGRLSPIPLVAAGGAAGALARHGALAADWQPSLVVLALNVFGSLLLGGIAAQRAAVGSPSSGDRWTALLGVGFCGGLTTFSTHAVDVAVRLDEHQWFRAAASLGATTALCVAAAGVGHRLVRFRTNPSGVPS